jgi:hypothetical protein
VKENTMGWLFTQGQTHKELVARRTLQWDHTRDDGTVVRSVCLRHCYRGGAFSGVLWTVWERTSTKDQQIEVHRWIGCDLLLYQNTYGWGYKDMAEEMHPFYYSCPLGYLAMVPVACAEWREGVKAYHVKMKVKREARKAARRSA